MSQTFLTQKGDDDITISMSDILPVSSVFQRLANDKFCAKNRCILLTVRYDWLIFICAESTSFISTAVSWVLIRRSFLQGKGYPDVATRRYLVHGIYECHTLNPISLVTSFSCQSYSSREHQEHLRGLIWLSKQNNKLLVQQLLAATSWRTGIASVRSNGCGPIWYRHFMCISFWFSGKLLFSVLSFLWLHQLGIVNVY